MTFGGKQPGAGRPRKEVDWKIFESLCEIQCTQAEICSVMKICKDTLCDKVIEEYGQEFSSIYKTYADEGKKSLRRFQFNLAKRNPAMCIWLGKQWLGQREPESINATAPNDQKIDLTFDLLNKNKLLTEELDAIKSKTNPEL